MLQSLIEAAGQNLLLLCAHFSVQRGDQNSSRASQKALARANPSLAGSRCTRHADALWPNNRLTQVSRRAIVPARCHAILLLTVPANRHHRYPKHFFTRSGEEKKHQNTEEEEKNIPPVCSEERKNIGCGTYILRLLFGLQREVLLVCDEWSWELLHFKALGPLLLLLPQEVRLGRGVEWVKRWSRGSHGSVGAVQDLKARAGGIPLLIRSSVSILCWSLRNSMCSFAKGYTIFHFSKEIFPTFF